MLLNEMTLGTTSFVIERRVNRPAHTVAMTLRDRQTVAPATGFDLGDGTLIIDETPRLATHPVLPGHPSWRTTARLVTESNRIVARLDVEIGEWAPDSVVIQLRPLGRSPRRWSARRTRRYFSLAHAGADRLEHLLNDGPVTAQHEVPALTIRPIEPRDIEELRGLFWRMSPESRYFRFLSPLTHPAEGCLHRLAEVDHRDRDALVATIDDHVVAVARYDRDVAEPSRAEVAVVVEDAWHRHGVATALLCELTSAATARGVEHFTATVAAENRAVSRLVRSFPVRATWNWEQGQRYLDIDLRTEPIAS